MEKVSVNPILVRQKAETEEGKKFAKELEDLNWEIQSLVFEQCKLQAKYELKTLEYREFLGYPVDDKKKAELEEEVSNYDSTL